MVCVRVAARVVSLIKWRYDIDNLIYTFVEFMAVQSETETCSEEECLIFLKKVDTRKIKKKKSVWSFERRLIQEKLKKRRVSDLSKEGWYKKNLKKKKSVWSFERRLIQGFDTRKIKKKEECLIFRKKVDTRKIKKRRVSDLSKEGWYKKN
jgi:hypothetical protein